ncbi:unnamed protein product [Orchesella dallaii]|uniref:Uncharacterized protein n=1 Tax=Orchesella dallaii TaxID=48710 RepID=A0ABP1PKK7_9HEXA
MRKVEDPLVVEIVDLHKGEDFRGILRKIRDVVECGDKSILSDLHLLSWPAPTEADLQAVSRFTRENEITRVYSIGCGTGLLEWLIEKVIRENKENFTVTGIEIDFGWWSGVYAPPTFLPLLYVDKNFNVNEPFGEYNDMALFCYFNNLKIFIDYLAVFKGNFIAILGPISTTQFCAPAPLELVKNNDMPCKEWKLTLFQPFGLGNVDHIAIYKRVL